MSGSSVSVTTARDLLVRFGRAWKSSRLTVVLIEGPSDADPLVMLAASESMEPPIALLAYATGEPSKAAFWPFAVFSPEWQALQWAAKNGVQARFCDLPAFNVLADQGIRTVREGRSSVGTGRGRGFRRHRTLVGFGDRI